MKIVKSLTFVFATLLSFGVYSQSTTGPVSISMGGTFVTSTHFWNILNNQSGLAYIKEPTVGIGYDNGFLMKELGTKYLSFAMPVGKNSGLGITVDQFGFNLFNQTHAGLGYGMKLSRNFALGVNLDYYSLNIGDIYGKTGALSFQAGCTYVLSKSWILGVHLFNPVMAKLADYNDERLSTAITAGCSFIASEQVTLSADIEKDMAHDPSLRFGVNYKVVKFMQLRTGFATNPTRVAFGFSLDFLPITIDFASSYHEVLGFNPSTGITYRFKHDKNEQ